jgi:hypothetical protein
LPDKETSKHSFSKQVMGHVKIPSLKPLFLGVRTSPNHARYGFGKTEYFVMSEAAKMPE